MKTKFAIGCLVQWYEVDLIRDYVESLADAIKQAPSALASWFTSSGL